MSEKTFRCPECGMHYRDRKIAKRCEDFCRSHQACSLEIAKLSIEAGAA